MTIAESISEIEGTDYGQAMHDLMAQLYPICRSITGDGVRQTLNARPPLNHLEIVRDSLRRGLRPKIRDGPGITRKRHRRQDSDNHDHQDHLHQRECPGTVTP